MPSEAGRPARLTAWAQGRVQGVGFRWWVRARALELGLSGWAENMEDGRVKVVAEGPADACEQLLMLLEGGETPGRVVRLTYRWDEPQGISGFSER
ncbi:MAG: acylphosphatase [Streptosporangiaceae bacterium]|jgi:acylphosphatase|nr:acylphosphatase [Actinomycetota bacterium]